MNKFIFFLLLASMSCKADIFIDFTDPSSLKLADVYPGFESLRIVNFNDTNNGWAYAVLQPKNKSSEDAIVFGAEIASDRNGKQRLYIHMPVSCETEGSIEATSVIKTNGNNVKYNRYCSGEEIYLSPTSDAGSNYLVSEFKRKDHVCFEFIRNTNICFDATGFTHSWKRHGGDAI